MKKIDDEIDEGSSILLENISYSCSRLLKLKIEFSFNDEEFRSMRKNIIHWNK